ncbi:MAG: Holliday junction branch migration protein RuvA [Planctomycetota bacterium]
MIDFVEGRVASKDPENVTIDVGGVGLRALIPVSTYAEIPPIGDEAHLLTYLYVREDQLTLYGFATKDERSLFQRLLNVNRIGPAVAMQVLSSCPVEDFRQLVSNGDVKALANMVKGVGKKTAQRLVLELKGELAEPEEDRKTTLNTPAASTAIKALVKLGVSMDDARTQVEKKLKQMGPDVDESALINEIFSE